MNSAAVGFQCPECVREGRKATRSGRTAYGGLRPTDASVTTMVLIGLNALVWLVINLTGRNSSTLLRWFELRPRSLCLGPHVGDYADALSCQAGATLYPGVDDGAYWQLITSGFTHVEVWHIASNMLFLYLVGPQLDAVLGRVRFLALYFLSLLAGSTLVYWAAPDYQSTVGASGAIFGLMGALLVICIKRHLDLRQVLILIVANFAITFAISGISWQGHLGGFLGGAAVAAALVWPPAGRRRAPLQTAGLGAIGVVLVVLILVRSAALG